MNVLAEANKLVYCDRNRSYGHPLDDFSCAASMWTSLLRRKYGATFPALSPEDVGLMMICVKLSREMSSHKDDNLIDIAGYAQTVAMVREEREKRSHNE